MNRPAGPPRRLDDNLLVPNQFAGLRVQSNHMQIRGGHIYSVFVKRKPHFLRRSLQPLPLIPPQHIPVRRINCENRIRVGVKEHDSLMNQRHRHARAEEQRSAPGRFQVLQVLFINLFQRTVTLAGVSAAPMQPVIGRGVEQHLIGHGRKIVQ